MVNFFAAVYAVTLEALWTFAALSLLIRAGRDKLPVLGFLPAVSIVDCIDQHQKLPNPVQTWFPILT